MGGRHAVRGGNGQRPAAAKPKMAGSGQDNGLLILERMLFEGFCTSSSYSDMSRERAFMTLKEGVTAAQLLGFCRGLLKNEPLPDPKNAFNGGRLVALFKEAEKAGLVTLTISEPSKSFVPELGSAQES